MTNREENRLSMYITLRDYQRNYTAITDRLPSYAASSLVFMDAILRIELYSQKQKTNKSGVAEDKNLLKETLIVKTADNARKLNAYAVFTGKVVLAREVKFTENKLRHSSDTAVKDYAQIVFDRANAHLNELTPYDITAETQQAFQKAITDYDMSLGKPGVSRAESGQHTQTLKTLFKNAEEALQKMNTAVEIVRLSQPEFYNGYQNARKIIYNGTTKLAVKASVSDALTGDPLRGVTVSFMLDGDPKIAKASNGKPELVKKTADKGGFIIKSLAAGIYRVNLRKPGYTDQDIQLVVENGETSVLNVKLARN